MHMFHYHFSSGPARVLPADGYTESHVERGVALWKREAASAYDRGYFRGHTDGYRQACDMACEDARKVTKIDTKVAISPKISRYKTYSWFMIPIDSEGVKTV